VARAQLSKGVGRTGASRGRMSMMPSPTLISTMEVVLRVSALVGGALAVWTFWRTAKVRRAEWLSTLHAKFFESENYKHIRSVLDYQTEPEFSRLRRAIASGGHDPLVEEFVDYLNFFEFVASLRRLGQLKSKEISMLFQYYLSLLCSHDFVRHYIQAQDFENLHELLSECVPHSRKS
jgi:hypothetical protein